MEKLIDDVEIIDPNLEELDSTLDHVEKFAAGVESILSQYRAKGSVSYVGSESYTVGIFKAGGLQWNINSGLENFITDGLKKLMDMIKQMCRSIWNYFFGGGESDSASIEDDVKATETMEKAAKNIERTGEAVLDASQIKKAIDTGIDSAARGRPVPAPIAIKVVDARSSEQKLTAECEHAYAQAAAEAYEQRKKKLEGRNAEIDKLQTQMKAEAAEGIRKTKEKVLENEVVNNLRKELSDRVMGSKPIRALLNRIEAPVKVLVDFTNQIDDDKDRYVLISDQFCLPGGSYWYSFNQALQKNDLSVGYLADRFGKEMEGYVRTYTKELEKAQEQEGRWRGLSDEEKMTMFNNSRRALKALTEIAAAIKSNAKKIKNIYTSTFANYEKMKAKRLAAELSKL